MAKTPTHEGWMKETDIAMALIDEVEESKCAKLHALLAEKRERFDFPPPFSELPVTGVYFIFERGQSSHGHPRIVRIGSHSGTGRLVSRLWEHAAPHGRSIFRYELGLAVIGQPGAVSIEPIAKDLWQTDIGKLATADEQQEQGRFEAALSAYLKEQFQFSVIGAATSKEALVLEKECIATVANCDACKEAQTSKLSPPPQLSRRHLWNKHHTGKDARRLSDSSWLLLVKAAQAALGGING